MNYSRKFFLLLLVFKLVFIFNCASTKHLSHQHTKTDPLLISKLKGQGNIELLSHQLLPIDYLHKHPEQKGLLINHYMGTGKTYLGIGFAESFTDKPVIILAPKFLESNWINSIHSYGVSDSSRYQFISYDDAPHKLKNIDITNYIILADEVHNLIKYMRTLNQEINTKYTEVYMKLRQAYKILGLTGTPIYGDESDIAFVLNLVSGQDVMPFNQETFRLAYTKILPYRQFFRGYLTENNYLFIHGMPLVFGQFFGAMFGMYGMMAGMFIPSISFAGLNWWLDLNSYKLRKLDVEKMQDLMSNYVSYFRFDESKFKDFPAQDFEVKTIAYNKHQYSFFLRLVEGDLPTAELQRLLKNEPIKYSDDYVKINSSNIHEQLYSSIGSGRDIGNFDFIDDEGQVIEPPKFMEVYHHLKQYDEPTVIYSNYYETGILAFKEFLLRQQYNKPFAIIKPDLSMQEVNDIVSSYNKGDIKLLLLHPDITEGISLKGTQYLHILEPMLNPTVLEQVVGRARRFQSHSHLPKNKQTVHVRMWQSTSSTWDPTLGEVYRANWYKRYRELSYMSRWGIGIYQVDKKIDRKALNPEELALLKLRTIEANFKEMQDLLTSESIEKAYK